MVKPNTPDASLVGTSAWYRRLDGVSARMVAARSSPTKSGLPAAGRWYMAATSGCCRAAQRHRALAVLDRLHGVFGRQGALGLGQLAQRGLDIGQGRLRIELARDDQHGVVGLVILVVEGAQLRDVHVLDVAARADGALAVVVPLVGGGLHLLHEHAERVVLAAFHLVADHGHLGVEVFLGDQRVDHGVGLPAQVPLEGFGIGREAGEVIGAIRRGGAVGLQATARELAQRVADGGRALEQHVLEQVGHAGLAVVLVARSHQVRHVDRGGGLGRVGRQQHAQAVGQAVFGNALDRGHFRDARGERRGAGLESQERRH